MRNEDGIMRKGQEYLASNGQEAGASCSRTDMVILEAFSSRRQEQGASYSRTNLIILLAFSTVESQQLLSLLPTLYK